MIFYLKLVFCNRPVDIINAVNDISTTIKTFQAGYSAKYTCLTDYVEYDEKNKNESCFLFILKIIQQHNNINTYIKGPTIYNHLYQPSVNLNIKNNSDKNFSIIITLHLNETDTYYV